MKIKYYLLAIILLIISNSCSKNEDSVIEAELKVHFSQFKIEADLREVNVDMHIINISGYVENIRERGVLGQCKSYSDGSSSVIIDNNFWQNATDSEKEYIVFHELGHCALDRSHNNSHDENGVCRSIMQSGENECNGTFNQNNRKELIDELFFN